LVLGAPEQATQVLMEVFLFMPQPVVEGRPELLWQRAVDEVALLGPQQGMQAALVEALPGQQQAVFLAEPGLLGKGITAARLPFQRYQGAPAAAVLLL
jgi:hypothetical protein